MANLTSPKTKSNLDIHKDFTYAIDKERSVAVANKKMSLTKQKALLTTANWFRIQSHILSVLNAYTYELDELLCNLQTDFYNRYERHLSEYNTVTYIEKEFHALTSPLQQKRDKVKKLDKEFKAVSKTGGNYIPQALRDKREREIKNVQEMALHFEDKQLEHNIKKQRIVGEAVGRSCRLMIDHHSKCYKIQQAKQHLLDVFYVQPSPNEAVRLVTMDEMEEVDKQCGMIVDYIHSIIDSPAGRKLDKTPPRYKRPRITNDYLNLRKNSAEDRKEGDHLGRSISEPIGSDKPHSLRKTKSEKLTDSKKEHLIIPELPKSTASPGGKEEPVFQLPRPSVKEDIDLSKLVIQSADREDDLSKQQPQIFYENVAKEVPQNDFYDEINIDEDPRLTGEMESSFQEDSNDAEVRELRRNKQPDSVKSDVVQDNAKKEELEKSDIKKDSPISTNTQETKTVINYEDFLKQQYENTGHVVEEQDSDPIYSEIY